jgi:hypothetical protein
MEQFLSTSLIFCVQNGEMVRSWQDNWRESPLKKEMHALYTFAYNSEQTIKETITTTNWNEQFRHMHYMRVSHLHPKMINCICTFLLASAKKISTLKF